MIQLKVGTRGEIVIPKKIRESLGLRSDTNVILQVKQDAVEIRPADESIAEHWSEIAEREGIEVDETSYGDTLYKEAFE